MDQLVIEASVNSPSINFDSKNNRLTITGRSIPEHVIEFYQPLEEWVRKYLETIPKEIAVEICLDYLNTHSTSRLLVLLRILENYHNNSDSNVKVTWCFEDEDEDMEELGEELSSLLEIPFQMKKYD